MHCVEGECRAQAVAWLTFDVRGQQRSWPFCEEHMRAVIVRSKRRHPDVPVLDKRRAGKRWQS